MQMRNRTRRLRSNSTLRNLVAEVNLNLNKFIEPLFLLDPNHTNDVLPITSMPGIARRKLKPMKEYIKEQVSMGIKSFAIFPVIPENLKDSKASYAVDKNNFYLDALKEIKQTLPEVLIMTDIALDPYSSDGHDGLVKDGKILNDETIDILSEMALLQAQAGADLLGPSDMMDGRVLAIREVLESNGFIDTAIISYCAKFASSFYGPFRDALDSAPKAGDKKTYQLDYRNRKAALLELHYDEIEFADILMIKPALPYLDIISDFKNKSNLPIAAYQVSGEYATLHFAAQQGAINLDQGMIESISSIHRAGADIILTYFAKDLAKLIND